MLSVNKQRAFLIGLASKGLIRNALRDKPLIRARKNVARAATVTVAVRNTAQI